MRNRRKSPPRADARRGPEGGEVVESAQRALKTPAGFTRQEYMVNGVRTVVHVGGKGRPVVYWHGAGSWHGFDFVTSWLDRLQIIATSHPGWGESADPPAGMNAMGDYVLHYLELFEMMKLPQFDLIGVSLGGWMAAEFAVAYRERLRKLVLVAPAGLPAPQYPGPPGMQTWTLDEMYGYLVDDLGALRRHLPVTPEEQAAHGAAIAREMQSAGRLFSPAGAVNPKLERWLHRVTMPTLLVWSQTDRLAPVGRHEKWMQLLPSAQLKLVQRGGHLILDDSAEARDAVLRFLS
jgi:pimeloyl-ACP methyl ester carboxylesterase